MGYGSPTLGHRIKHATAALALATAGLTGAVVAVGVQSAAGATNFVVTNTADTGADSLRDVLENQISDGDTVELTAGATYTLDDCLEGDIDVDGDVTINGNGATIKQTCESRVLFTDSDLTLNFVTITGGVAFSGGGGVFSNSGDLTIYGSTIVDNFACDNGGGIHVHGDTFLSYSTITDNTSLDDGGAIANDDEEGGDIHVLNSTITKNTAGEVGGIENDEGDTFLTYTTLVDNTTNVDGTCDDSVQSDGHAVHEAEAGPQADTTPANIRVQSSQALHTFASVIALAHGGISCGDFSDDPLTNTDSGGYNFADSTSCDLTATGDSQVDAANAMLGALGGNGGPTMTMLPQTGSPLLNAIPLAACVPVDVSPAVKDDQRFLVRPDVVNQKCDIGAVEVQTEAPVEIQPNFTG